MFKKIDPKMKFPEMEKEVLKFWEENKIFEKSLENRKDAPIFSFYDGPPFASGSPHYGHIVGSTMKDAVPRFWTMKGYKVPRKWGWDCHGLPIENIAEKELGIKHKKEIEEMGVDKFNEFCRTKVLKYVDEWKMVINRLGRWADMKNSYKTMDLSFMESVWWVFKELYDKGLIYEGHRIMHICTRCETTLSQSEVAEGYKDIKDLSAKVKFELEDEPGTFVLAWTTTPWTLIGNVALAIKKDINYITLENSNKERIIIGYDPQILHNVLGEYKEKHNSNKNLLNRLPEYIISEKGEEYNVVGLVLGKDLVGKKYKPLFYYYTEKGLENEENGWKIYAGDFVTTEEGTGVVHIAPAFGEDDAKMGQEFKLPFVQHVGMDGIIKPEATDFAGMSVKPEKDHQSTDVEVIKYLAKNNLLFSKEKYEHSYPHCWRCDTPLINYATSSWFVDITKIKEEMLENAKEINWIPSHLKEGRFGNWLEGARDWSISRQRFWASVIPIWKCDCGEMKVVGSVSELRELSEEPITKIIFVRHGESEKNVKHILSDSLDKWPLTEKGKKDIESIRETIEDKVDAIITSPVLRAKETAEILNEKLKTEIIKNDLIKEISYGKWNEKTTEDRKLVDPDFFDKYQEIKNDPDKRFNFKLGKTGESRQDVSERTVKFLSEISEKYAGKTVLVVGHGITYATFTKYFEKLSAKDYFDMDIENPDHKLISIFYSQKEAESFDLHKDKLDKITFKCEECGGTMKRIPDVLDTWFDSGSMPYAQAHYPFENKENFDKTFPAEFIAEGVDQTRCWFYYLHVIATAITGSDAFKNVAVNGIVQAEDGKKMSKRLKNYPDPSEIFDKYGADALRFYLLSSPVVSAETINFKESEVAELVRGILRMLWNSYSFFVLYANIDKFEMPDKKDFVPSVNLLDRWIMSELNMLIKGVNDNMEKYELSKTVRLFPKFIDNLSNWYIRRSRKRFWKSENDGDKNNAYQTLYIVLVELSKLMAPFTPFIAEEIYKNLTGNESVHLKYFPEADEELIDYKLSFDMSILRQVISDGLQFRAEKKIKVRQPLQSISIPGKYAPSIDKSEYIEIIKEELNVEEVIFGDPTDKLDDKIILDTEITQDLEYKGQAREIIRHIQEMRKEAGYEVDNRIKVSYDGMGDVFEKFCDIIKKETLADSLDKERIEDLDIEREFKIDDKNVKISLKK